MSTSPTSDHPRMGMPRVASSAARICSAVSNATVNNVRLVSSGAATSILGVMCSCMPCITHPGGLSRARPARRAL